jgi:hypothetical protein
MSPGDPTDEPTTEPDPADDGDRSSRDLDVSGEPEPDWAEAIRRGRRERADRLREVLEAGEDETTEPAE